MVANDFVLIIRALILIVFLIKQWVISIEMFIYKA